jgi:hypothetical protein
MINQMRNLEELHILSNGLSWPGAGWFENNAPGFSEFWMNSGMPFPLVLSPFHMAMIGTLTTIEEKRPATSSYILHKPLRRLTIHKDMFENNPWLDWLLAQEQKLSSINTLKVTVCYYENTIALKAMLEAMSSLRNLTIHEESFGDVDPSWPAVINHAALEYLEIRPRCSWVTLQTVLLRTENIFRTIKSPSLTSIRLAFEFHNNEFIFVFGEKNTPSAVSSLDSYLGRTPNLQQIWLDVEVRLARGTKESDVRRMFKGAFRLCEARGILDVKVVKLN